MFYGPRLSPTFGDLQQRAALAPYEHPHADHQPMTRSEPPTPRPRGTGPRLALDIIDVSALRSVYPRPHGKKMGPGKADPIWDVKFDLKFGRHPKDAETPRTPKGALKVLDDFIDRAAELEYLARTQHLELASTYSEMKANGFNVRNLDYDPTGRDETDEIPDSPRDDTSYRVAHTFTTCACDIPNHDGRCTKTKTETRMMSLIWANRMRQRIDWQRAVFASGKVTAAFFEPTKEGTLGLGVRGPAGDPDGALAARKRLKYGWLDTHDRLPTPDELPIMRAQAVPIRARMDTDMAALYQKDLAATAEDFDPHRDKCHAEPDPKPERDLYPWGPCSDCSFEQNDDGTVLATHRGCTIAGWELFNDFLALWQQRHKDDIGYAGPSGLLGLDDDAPDEEDDSDSFDSVFSIIDAAFDE